MCRTAISERMRSMSAEERKTASDKNNTITEQVRTSADKEAGATKERVSSKVPAQKNAKKSAEKKKNAKEKSTAKRVGDFAGKNIQRFNRFTSSEGVATDKEIRPLISFRFFICACLVLTLLMVMVLQNQSTYVRMEAVGVAGLPDALENYTILHVSDLNAAEFGADQTALLRTINSLSYDIMLITGDMVGTSGDAEPFLAFLRGLKRKNNVYFIAGDADPGPLRASLREGEGTLEELVLEDWILDAIEIGATYVDSPKAVTIGSTGTKLWISPFSQLGVSAKQTVSIFEDQLETELIGYLSGIGADYASYPFTDYRYRVAQKLLNAAGQMGADDVHIALAHVPPTDSMISITQDNHSDTPNEYLHSADLILAGHYCGGVWKMPGYGAMYIPDALHGMNGWFPDQARVSGQVSLGSSILHVTGGLSTSSDVKLPFRLFNQPEVSLITLTGLLTDNMFGN
ncbi:MAG: metallophosphoesterase [Clostridiales bacterium]|nr:metallophosphoesterase [Clostridiales bacterium]